MGVLELNEIGKFIRFTIDLFNDEFDYCIDYVDSFYYFLHGGCFELAQIIKHYFKDAELVERKDGNHCAILYKGKIYDAYSAYDEERLYEMGYTKEEFEKKLEDYSIMNEEDIKRVSEKFGVGKNIDIEGKNVVDGIINELDNIESIRIG